MVASNEDIMHSLGETQSDIKNICNTLDGMKGFMLKQIEQHTTTNVRLAVIERVQNDMSKGMDSYTMDCTKDRTSQDKRITEVEGFQNRQVKVAGLAGGFIAFLVAGGMRVLEKIFS